MTATAAVWLQFWMSDELVPSACRAQRGCKGQPQEKIVTAQSVSRSSPEEAKEYFADTKMKQTMKRNILTLVATGAIALGGFVVVQAQGGSGGPGHRNGHAFGLWHLTEKLDLTAEQQTKVQPILDAAKPQMRAIHEEAMQKAKGVIESSLSQIRPLLTADQQKKLDAIQKAHQDMMNAQKELHNAMQD
jgi:Spy/CpxP family protein refolding chaperone